LEPYELLVIRDGQARSLKPFKQPAAHILTLEDLSPQEATSQVPHLEKRFAVLDADGDGVIDADDYRAMAGKIVEGYAQRVTPPKAKAIEDAYLGFWSTISSTMDTDGDGRLSSEELGMAITSGSLAKNPAFGKAVDDVVSAVVNLADLDGSG